MAVNTTARVNAPLISKAKLEAGVLAAVRVVASFLFVSHGGQGTFGWFGGVDGAGAATPFGQWPGYYAGVIEMVGGALILIGLFTRYAAVLCSGVMAYAYFVVHQPMGLHPLENMGELSAIYSWVFLLIAVFGPGALALDNLRRSRR
ncbi:DoxX family protein [Allokutzneria sp. NRRL B-24872]|uniref:DoxX family protein n=1 Tax=Allokutzneria sp. NRRL B-24872 TaxID=1137961 RepID=UPI000A375EE3|nr:DoxX family protein [Allokutzneria sp. NRRL B-24872]